MESDDLTGKQKYKRDMDVLRSVSLVAMLQKEQDKRARDLVEGYQGALTFDEESRHSLLIEEDTWRHVVEKKYDPRLVFCHPTLLQEFPSTSLYYRGMTGLSRKAVSQLARSVDKAETDPNYRFRNEAAPLRIARLYNFFICSIITASEDWALENGYRSILATMGITFDGTSRNKVGDVAEERVRKVLLEFVIDSSLASDAKINDLDGGRRFFPLSNGITMKFSDEPDVFFTNSNDEAIATIEIKGGLDPAGALERLGATQKSFRQAISKAPNCMTYLVAGVVTESMLERLLSDRNFTKHFSMIDILTETHKREEFLREVFHYGLRLIP